MMQPSLKSEHTLLYRQLDLISISPLIFKALHEIKMSEKHRLMHLRDQQYALMRKFRKDENKILYLKARKHLAELDRKIYYLTKRRKNE